ncbi:MISP protein, partial [Turnix velox]|nr:MISP protein [Turnix velox]
DEDEEEERRVPPPNISPEKARELEDERREVIRGQVMRKSSTMAERWSSMDELSSINTSSGGQSSFSSSFALSWDKTSPRRAPTPVDPENIDTEQINFSAARQQFLMLEKNNPGSFVSPGHQIISPKPESTTRVSRQEWSSPEVATKATRGNGSTGGAGQSKVYQVHNVREGRNGLEKEEVKTSNETPIEREIRMALEREENLWKERGIQRLTSSSELVEIHTKPLLFIRSSPSPGRKGKDKGRASLYVQREILQETKREEDLKRQGRLLGTYDKGTPQELDERRKIFEQEETPPQKPPSTASRKAEERRSWANEFMAEKPTSHGHHPSEDPKGGRSFPTSTVSTLYGPVRPLFIPYEKSVVSQPLEVVSQPLEEVSQPMVVSHHVSSSKWGSKDSPGGSTPSPISSSREVLPREYFSLSFWKPKFSLVEDMGTERREDGREEQYKLRTWKPQRSLLIDEEIRSDLQREEELQEQRRRQRRQMMDGHLTGSTDGFPQGGHHSRHSSAASGASGSYSVSTSPVSSPASHHGGVLGLISSFTPLRVAAPSQDTETLGPDSTRSSPFEERRRRVREDGKYAGIEPVDKINTEVVESTRVVRHKSAMAQRWEAGQYVRDED